MSRWLKSVNNLLENLDGKAEEVAADGVGNIPNFMADQTYNNNTSTDEDEDEDEDYEDYSDDEAYDYEEEDIVGTQARQGDVDEDDDGLPSQQHPYVQQNLENGPSTKIVEEPSAKEKPRRKLSTVSDITNSATSTDFDEFISLQTSERPAMRVSQGSAEMRAASVLAAAASSEVDPREDFPPQAPNRNLSLKQDIQNMAMSRQNNGLVDNQGRSEHSRSPIKSPKVDQSPRFPKRSIEQNEQMPHAGASLLEDSNSPVENDSTNIDRNVTEKTMKESDNTMAKESLIDSNFEQPPKQPSRNPSLSTDPSKEPSPAIIETNKNIPTPSDNKTSGSSHMKTTKEMKKMKDKIEQLQIQLSKSNAEKKTGQSQLQSLKSQNQTLESQLEAANSEIKAQQDELRRAGERMEKDRRRAQEEREDLLDEQDDELDQIKQAHEKEVNGLREQYEKQIEGLTEQLQNEETRRRQEGGDFTNELQDAIEREREALKQLNAMTSEKSELQTKISKLKVQEDFLQNKLNSALSSVKTATKREREAEEKMDAAMSLHSRQINQRQSREAELEKTIFDLGTALTVARQNQPSRQISSDEAEGDSFKDKYIAVAEEVETLKVQLNMETQRREALQEELNEIAKERTEEVASLHSRQGLHDRKVAELESTISRLQSKARDAKGMITHDRATGEGQDTQSLLKELEATKHEVGRLSSQLLRHQRTAETSKSEILALKGRLTSATSRAEQAEQSLQVAQRSNSTVTNHDRLHLMETGGVVGGMRRRFKGGNARTRNRTIRSALQMNPGRVSHPLVEQIAVTLDGVDTWMIETGSFLRHEPLARLGFMLYLLILHLWSFSLVMFHVVEEPHPDFGSLDGNPRHWRAAVIAAQQQQQHQT